MPRAHCRIDIIHVSDYIWICTRAVDLQVKMSNKRTIRTIFRTLRKTVIGSVHTCQYSYQRCIFTRTTHNCKYKKIDDLDSLSSRFALHCFRKTATFDNIYIYIYIYLRTNRIKYIDVDSKLPCVPSYNLANSYNPWENVTQTTMCSSLSLSLSQYWTHCNRLRFRFRFLRFVVCFPNVCKKCAQKPVRSHIKNQSWFYNHTANYMVHFNLRTKNEPNLFRFRNGTVPFRIYELLWLLRSADVNYSNEGKTNIFLN